MTKNAARQKHEKWDFALLYLALLKRGELIPVYEEAQKKAWRAARAAYRRKIN
jgi:hypothetical protein